MKRCITEKTVCLIVVLLSGVTNLLCQKKVDKVNLFIATAADHGQLDPSAAVPWGMVKVGPDTEPGNHSGYDYNALKLKGFSHNRIGGVGCEGAGGNFRVLPGIGDSPVKLESIDKATETARPGYYAVQLKNGISVKLTATNNMAIHKYEFPKSESVYVSIDLKSSFADLIHFSVDTLAQKEFAVSVSAKNVCNKGRYTVSFYAAFDAKPSSIEPGKDRLLFKFKTGMKKTIQLFVTASSLSWQDAREDWNSRSPKTTFKHTKEMAEQKWEQLLSRISVEGDKEYESLFYTHLYHTLLNPVKTENRNKNFKATNGKIYASDGYVHHGAWSMWDNFRNKFSLYALVYPESAYHVGRSLVDLFTYGKPVWSGYHEPVPTVRTEHSIITLLDLYNRGITNFDLKSVYGRMGAEIENTRARTPDQKLEKAYDYWALSEIARLLNKTEDQAYFTTKYLEYRDTWNRYFAVMDSASDVMHAKGLYEGTPWQYRWHVQFDIAGLLEIFGGVDVYTKALEYFFENNLYNHGNQPDIHVPFMFNYSSKPWLTQKWVNRILTKKMYQYYGTHEKWAEPYFGRIYRAQPKGYIPEMDDDDGTMSAWYVFSFMGLYPVEVGKPIFQLSAPIFDKITFHFKNGKSFEIITKNRSETNFYIKSIFLNEKKQEP